jgi:hypothetical protein
VSAGAPEIRIVGGNPSPEEIAAVTAVLSAALDELAGQERRAGDAGSTGWQLSQRAVRRPLARGGWRDFQV